LSLGNLTALPRATKHLLALGTDAALCVLTVWLAICFRFESWVSLSDYQWLAVAVSLALAIPLLSFFGFYHTVIRFAGRQTILAALRAIAIYTIVYSAIFTAYGLPLVPRTIGILQPLLLLIGLGFVRILASQLLNETIAKKSAALDGPGVLIYGAGHSGQQLAAALHASGQSRVIGFLDDNTNLHQAQISGIAIYPPSALDRLIATHAVRDVLLAMPSLSRSRRNDIIKSLGQRQLIVRTLPSLSDLASGKITEGTLRELDIDDLLGRDPVAPISALLSKNITGKTVLVTGAGGSIGGELCRQISRLKPAHLIALELSEFALYGITETLTPLAQSAGFKLSCVLANVQDQNRMMDLLAEHRPNTIYHAAAYKHVPLVESNPLIGLRNNVLGTYHVAQAALASGVDDMVLISTDKAVRPTNIMGASKRLAEIVLQTLARGHSKDEKSTRFCMVRFGNVLGSSGSVVPKFREQIKQGGPVTITHPDITRYFMSIPEAAQLVIQAGALHTSHCLGAPIYLLDMGESVKIVQLARTMIALSAHPSHNSAQEKEAIQIVFTGLRPGEKLYEELLIEGQAEPSSHPKIFCSLDSFDASCLLQTILQSIEDWTAQKADAQTIRCALAAMPLGYQPPP